MSYAMKTIDWLHTWAPGFKDLTIEECDAIIHFTLLWSLFEAKTLDTRASARKIVGVAKHWEKEKQLKLEDFADYLSYFQGRYYESGEFNQHFAGLHFQDHDNQALVEAVLKGEAKDIADIAGALLIIVWRLRNNLFHGVKWGTEIQGQLGNFTNANALLMRALEI